MGPTHATEKVDPAQESERARERAADRQRIAELRLEPVGAYIDIAIWPYACPASARSAIYHQARKNGLRVVVRGLDANGAPLVRGPAPAAPTSYRVFREAL